MRVGGGSSAGLPTEPSTPSPKPGRLVGIVAALPGEAYCLTKARVPVGVPYAIGPDALLVISGVGPTAARIASEGLVAAGAGALVSWGVAAGLNSAAIGSLVLADRVVVRSTTAEPSRADSNKTRELFSTESWTDRLAARLPMAVLRGPIVGTDRVLSTPAEKRAVGSFGALAADMESAAIAEVADRAGIPWIAIRAISDAADHGLPLSVVRAVNGVGQVKLVKLVGGLIGHPIDVLQLPRIAMGFNAALRTLRAVSAAVGPALLAPTLVDALAGGSQPVEGRGAEVRK